MNVYERGVKSAERVDAHMEMRSLTEALQKRDEEIKVFATKASEELKSLGQVSTETKQALEKLSEKGTDMAARLVEVEQKLARRGAGAAVVETKSLGVKLTEAEGFKSFAGQSHKGSFAIETKATITSATSGAGAAGGLIVPERQPGILQPAERALTIRSLLLPGSTSSNLVEYMKETGFTNAAASVAETGTLASSDITFTMVQTPVKDIGHMLTASRTILQDVPMLQSYIDQRMVGGMKLVEEGQLLSGDGTGQNLKGILPQATPFHETAYHIATDTKVDTIRRAALQVRMAELVPSFVVLNPIDWAEIETAKGSDEHYIWVNIQTGGTPVLWRLPVVETTVMAEGEFLVGAGAAAQIFDREDVVVELSTEHADYFSKRLVAIRAFERLALAVYRPESFVYGQFAMGTSPSIND